jgi:enoyl-CoA hydratase/carnithine racemase
MTGGATSESESPVLLVSREDRLLRLRLNRPAKRNALNRALCTKLLTAFDEAANDPGVGAILVEGEGPVFCAGLDLSEILSAEAPGDVELHDRLFNIGETLGKPIVAAVQGAALAGGMALVANSHVAVAAQGATFGMTEIRLGLFPFVVFRPVAKALGRRRAVELCLTGRIFSAPEALNWGLVQHLAPAFEFDDLALAIAQSLAASSPDAIRRGFSFLRALNDDEPGDKRALATFARIEALKSADLMEGVQAHAESRKPVWPSFSKDPDRLGEGTDVH